MGYIVTGAADGAALQTVRAQFEAMMLEPLLEPMEQAFGGYSEIAVQSFTQALAKSLAP
jgi:hypothetical protein